MTELLDVKAAAKLLETSVTRLMHFIDVGDVLPSGTTDVIDEDRVERITAEVEKIVEGYRS